MADVVNINTVTAANTVNVNTVTAANIVNVNTITWPSAALIESSNNLYLNNQGGDSDSSSINVTPDSMTTTCTRVDTGDGTSWYKMTTGIGHTGDFTLTVINFGTLPTENLFSRIDISDDASNAVTKSVSVSYSYFT